MAIGFSPNPRGGWISSVALPNRSPASTMSSPSTYSSPGGGPHFAVIESRNDGGSAENQSR
jgi:hypothetical protein